MPTPLVTLDDYLEINSIPLATPAFVITDMSDAYKSADQRGDDILVPHSGGVLAQQRRVTVTKRAFPITIFGDSDYEGNVNSDARAGLVENVDLILNSIVAPTGTGDGTRQVTWYRLDGSTGTAYAHVLGLDFMKFAPTTRKGVLRLSFPDGDWSISAGS